MPSWTLCVLEAESLAPELSTLLNWWSDLSYISQFLCVAHSAGFTWTHGAHETNKYLEELTHSRSPANVHHFPDPSKGRSCVLCLLDWL